MDSQPNPPPIDPTKDIQDNKDIAALGYVWILSIPIYFLRRNSPFVRFHAKQGMVLFAVSIVLWIIPVVGRLLELGVLALTVFGFVSAAQGKHSVIPLIGALTRGDWNGVRTDWKTFVHQVGDLFGGEAKDAERTEPTQPTQPTQATQETQSTQPPEHPQPSELSKPSDSSQSPQ